MHNQRMIYQDTLSYIETIVNDNSGAHFILLLDMNCNLYVTNHPYSVLIRDLMSRHSFISSFDLMSNFDPAVNYTRRDIKTNSYTLIDGILVSASLRNFVSNVRISDYGDNVSDHLPVELDLSISIKELSIKRPVICPSVNWNKLSSDCILGRT